MNLEKIIYPLSKGFLAFLGTFVIVYLGSLLIFGGASGISNSFIGTSFTSNDLSFVWIVALTSSLIAGFYFTLIDKE